MSQTQANEESQNPEDDVLAYARGEAVAGSSKFAKLEKAYFQMRKAGLRDKATCEYLGAQPHFFDSKASAVAPAGKPVGKKVSSQPKAAIAAVQAKVKEETIEAQEESCLQQTPELVLPGPCPARHSQTAENSLSVFRSFPSALVAAIEREPEPEFSRREFSCPDGTSFFLVYMDNELVEIRIEAGVWKKETSLWAFYDLSGKKLDELLGQMQVSERGDIIARRNDGYAEIQFFDGTFQIIQPDGSSETHYVDGWLVKTDVNGKRVYKKNGVEYVLGKDSRLEKKAPDLNAVASDKRLAELNGWKGGKDSWQSMQKKSGVWYKNAQGDSLKQDDKTGTTTVFHDDGTWEQVDKNGKLKIRLAV